MSRGAMNGPELLKPVFHFLDRIIHEQGDILYMALVYVWVPLIVWILSGGLRRKQFRRDFAVSIRRPPMRPPTIIGRESQFALK